MATVQAALKRGIEMVFQIEESELVAEPLPKADARRAILFYEAAEGGAGVLTRLASNPADLATVARAALKVIHYHEPASGIWTLEGLAQLEKTTVDGQRPCEPAVTSACCRTTTSPSISTSTAATSRHWPCSWPWPTPESHQPRPQYPNQSAARSRVRRQTVPHQRIT